MRIELSKKILALSAVGFLALAGSPTFTAYALEKKDVIKMVDEFVKNGLIPAQEGQKVLKKLNDMNDSDWKKINKVADNQKNAKPHLNKKTENSLDSASQSVDTESDDFKEVYNQIKAVMDGKK